MRQNVMSNVNSANHNLNTPHIPSLSLAKPKQTNVKPSSRTRSAKNRRSVLRKGPKNQCHDNDYNYYDELGPSSHSDPSFEDAEAEHANQILNLL